MTTAYPHEIDPELDDVAENHVLDPSELSDTIDPDAIIGLPSKPYPKPKADENPG